MRGAEGLLGLLRRTAGLPVAEVDPIPQAPHRHVALLHREALASAFGFAPSPGLTEGFPEAPVKAQAAFVHPGGGNARKAFSPEFYRAVSERLRASGFSRVVTLLGPAELERGLDAEFRGGETVMPPDATGLADWLENAAVFVGNDSGPSHLAGFMGISSVVFYRDTDPGVWGVLGRHVRRIRAEGEDEAMEKFVSAE
jgi:ADP-heptose:LPS heptosyltransferase